MGLYRVTASPMPAVRHVNPAEIFRMFIGLALNPSTKRTAPATAKNAPIIRCSVEASVSGVLSSRSDF
jgi:hypothetical protein